MTALAALVTLPDTFGDEDDRFEFFFGWEEPYPRGQHSALLMVPEGGGRGACHAGRAT